MAKNINRKVTIYVNGKEVENTLQSIRNEVIKLEREQRKLPIGCEEYIQKGKDIAHLKGILKAQKIETEELGNAWKDTAFKLTEYSNILMGIQSAFQMLDLGIGKVKDLAKAAAELDDAYGQVMKTTGLTHDQVKQLNELFKKMDTRTSREQLNELAYEAGKLGIQGVKDVAAFVDASDKINVALGDVLGDGAMVTIGKMAQVYAGSTDELAAATGDLKKQMLAIGSAVNELGKLSTANEHYLVDFAGRMGGIAVQAGLSADQILGFASALDQDMQKVEMSATAFQKFIGQIMKKPEEFAKQAGMSVKEFSALVKTDLNEALFSILQGFSGKGGYAELVNIFKDLGLDGARAASVISAMSNSIDKIRVAQAAANEQLKSGESIMGEFNTMNNTMQANAEKAKKRFEEVRIELGNELYPILIHLQKSGTVLMKGIAGVAQLLKNYPAIIIPVVTAILAWNRARIASFVTSGKLKGLIEKMIGLNKVEVVTKALQEKSEKKLIATKEAARLKYLQNMLAMEKEKLARQLDSKETLIQSAATKTKNRVYSLEVQVSEQAARAEAAHAAATKAAGKAFMSMPWGVIITALTTIAALSVKAWHSSDMYKVSEATKEAARQFGEAQGRLVILKERLDETKKGTEDYKKALEELKNEYPEIIAKHIDEEGYLRDLEKAYKDLSAAAKQSAYDRVFAEKTSKAYGDLAEKQADVINNLKEQLEFWITWKEKPSEAVKAEVEKVLAEQVRLIAEGKKNRMDAMKDFEDFIAKYGGSISQMPAARGGESDYTLILNQLNAIASQYEQTERIVAKYREALKPIKDEDEEITYQSLENAKKRKAEIEGEILVLKRKMATFTMSLENNKREQYLYSQMESKLYDLEAAARGVAKEITDIEQSLSGMTVEQMKTRQAAIKQEILSLQAKMHVLQSMAYISFLTKKSLEEDAAKIDQLNKEWLQLEQAIKKAEEDAKKAAENNGNGSGKETPAEKRARLAKEAWERFGNTYDRLMEKMDSKSLSGAAKVVADIDNSIRKMEDDLKMVTGKNAKEAAEKLENLKRKAAEWKQEQLNVYIQKMTDEFEKFAAKEKEADKNQYIQKAKDAAQQLSQQFLNIDKAISQAVLDADALTEQMNALADNDPERERLQKQIDKLNELIKKYNELKLAMQRSVFDRINTGDTKATSLSSDESQWSTGTQSKVNAMQSSGLGMLFDKSAFENYGRALENINKKYEKQKEKIQEAKEGNEEILMQLLDQQRAGDWSGDLQAKIDAREQEIQRLEQEQTILDQLKTTAEEAAEQDSFGKAIDKWITGLETFGQQAMQLWGSINTIINNAGERRLKKEKERYDEESKALQQKLDDGIISQEEYDEKKEKLDQEYDDKEKEIQKAAWERQKALNIGQAVMEGALAVLKALSSAPPPYNAILAGISGALAAVQIAAIATEPSPYAKGGFVNKKTYMMAGEAGREWVASNSLLTDGATAPIIDALEDYQRGNRRALEDIGMAQLRLPAALAASEEIGRNRVVVNPPAVTVAAPSGTTSTVSDPQLLSVMRELATYMKDPKNRQAIISRQTMEDFEKNEDFLRNMARL